MNIIRPWLKRQWFSLTCLMLVAVILGGAGIQIVNQPSTVGGNRAIVSLGTIGEKVITIGSIADAAGTVDYTYGAANANVQFQAALNALPATGGRLVVVSAGTISFAAGVTRAIDNVTIDCTGAGSYFTRDAVNPIFTAGGNNWVFTNLRTDAGGLNMGATTGWVWNNVTINATKYALRTPATIQSDVATGTAPFTVASTTKVTNLNADLVDGISSAGFLQADGSITLTGNLLISNVASPSASALTATASGVAGNLNGAYYYRVSYVTALGETGMGLESVVVNPVNKQVDLTNIPVSADSRVTGRNIYRTEAGVNPWTGPMKLVIAIGNNTATTYTDDIADGVLGAAGQWINTTGGVTKVNSSIVSATGDWNGSTIFGYSVGNPKGPWNNLFGTGVGNSNMVGAGNAAIGTAIFQNLTTGTYNIGMGDGPMQYATTASRNVALGDHVFYGNPFTGTYNTVVGSAAMMSSTSSDYSVAIGANSGYNMTTGDYNILIGPSSGYELTTESSIFELDNSVDAQPYMRGVMGGANTRSLTLNSAESAAGGGVRKSFTLNLTNHYFTGVVDTAWNAAIEHEQFDTGVPAQGASYLKFKIDNSEIFRLTRENTTNYLQMFTNLNMSTAGITELGGLTYGVSASSFSASNDADGDYMMFKARDSDTDAVVEVARLVGAADPYLQATTGFVLNPISSIATPVEGMMYYDSDDNKVKFWNGAAWETITSAP